MKDDKVTNNFNISFDSKVSLHGSKLLLETELNDDIGMYSENITRKIVETENELIKKSLKSLGWISPDDSAKIQHLLRRVAGAQSFYRCGWEGVDEEVKDLLTGVFNETI